MKKKPREFWLYKNGSGLKDPEYLELKPDPSLIDDFIHVIEASEVEELKSMLAHKTAQIDEQRRVLEKLVAELEKCRFLPTILADNPCQSPNGIHGFLSYETFHHLESSIKLFREGMKKLNEKSKVDE